MIRVVRVVCDRYPECQTEGDAYIRHETDLAPPKGWLESSWRVGLLMPPGTPTKDMVWFYCSETCKGAHKSERDRVIRG